MPKHRGLVKYYRMCTQWSTMQLKKRIEMIFRNLHEMISRICC